MADAALLGKVLDGKFRIDALLGVGAMGAVYRAQHLQMNKEVAVKILHPHLVSDERSRMRFLQEARVISSLHHPNIITVFAFGQAEHNIYIAMELLQGKTLADKLQQGPVAIELATHYVTVVARALALAHENGVVHRDIKPSNIVLEQCEGHEIVQVVDFGIAKFVGEKASQSMTATGAAVGTPYYMSPEQCANQNVDARSDIYSLGCVFYELLCGHPPFANADSSFAAMFDQMNTPVPPMPDTVPTWLQSVILKCLEKNPSDRFQTMDELAEAIQQRTSIPIRHAGTTGDPKKRTPVLPFMVASIVAVILFGSGMLWYLSQPEQSTRPSSELRTTAAMREAVERLEVETSRLADKDPVKAQKLFEKANLERDLYIASDVSDRRSYQVDSIYSDYTKAMLQTDDRKLLLQEFLERLKLPDYKHQRSDEDRMHVISFAQRLSTEAMESGDKDAMQKFVRIASENILKMPESTTHELEQKTDMIIQQVHTLAQQGMSGKARRLGEDWYARLEAKRPYLKAMEAQMLAAIGNARLQENNLPGAKKAFDKALALAKVEPNMSRTTLQRLAQTDLLAMRYLTYAGDPAAAVEIGKQAVDLTERVQSNARMVADVEYDLSQSMDAAKSNPAEISKLHDDIRAKYESCEPKDDQLFYRLCILARRKGDFEFVHLRRPDLALTTYAKALPLAAKIQETGLRNEADSSLANGQANCFMTLGRFAEVHQKVSEALAKARGYGAVAEAHSINAATYCKEGNKEKMIEAALAEYNTRNDSKDNALGLCHAAVRLANYYSTLGPKFESEKMKWAEIARQHATKAPPEGMAAVKPLFAS